MPVSGWILQVFSWSLRSLGMIVYITDKRRQCVDSLLEVHLVAGPLGLICVRAHQAPSGALRT
jgi:hypothetical protein